MGVIGVWGLGGVGKTHLLNNIKNSLDGDITFNHVLRVTASRGCSVEKIQTDIARQLNLKNDGNAIFDFLKKGMTFGTKLICKQLAYHIPLEIQNILREKW